MPETRLIKKLYDSSPNIIAVVNFPENKGFILPARAYLFDIEIDKIYGSVENAANHFIKRTKKIPALENNFILSFITGRNCNKNKLEDKRFERDLVYCEFEKAGNSNKFKTSPYLVKSDSRQELGTGEIQTTTPNINDDMLILLGLERTISQEFSFGDYAHNFPEFPEKLGLEYEQDL